MFVLFCWFALVVFAILCYFLCSCCFIWCLVISWLFVLYLVWRCELVLLVGCFVIWLVCLWFVCLHVGWVGLDLSGLAAGDLMFVVALHWCCFV